MTTAAPTTVTTVTTGKTVTTVTTAAIALDYKYVESGTSCPTDYASVDTAEDCYAAFSYFCKESKMNIMPDNL